MIRNLVFAALAGSMPLFTPAPGETKQSAHITAGDPAGRNVDFTFDQIGGGLRIDTHQVGNPGAKLSIWIDHSRIRLFSRILTGDDCKYGDGGAQCRIVVAANDKTFGRFVTAFKRGKTAHIEVQNAAVMQMSSDISLAGFAHQLGS